MTMIENGANMVVPRHSQNVQLAINQACLLDYKSNIINNQEPFQLEMLL
jgi:hypothetical protein